MSLYSAMEDFLEERRRASSLRSITPLGQRGSRVLTESGPLINLASNDYLGFAADRDLREKFLAALPADAAFGSGGSPLLTGAHLSLARAAETVRRLFGRECLFFNSGYAANSGLIAALGALPGTLLLADRLAHASLIDGLKASGARFARFPHNDYAALRSAVERESGRCAHIIVITEALFSMDGDECDLAALTALKRDFPQVYLYVDEAHSFGAAGERGLGLAAGRADFGDIDFVLCTCGKALGSAGAFVLCGATARAYFSNTVRPLIFSTALPPVVFEHIRFMLEENLRAGARRERLAAYARAVGGALRDAGVETVPRRHIIPLITGSSELAVRCAGFFRDRGFYALPVRYPAVPRGQARVRLSLSAGLEAGDIERLCAAIREFACASSF